MVIGGGMIGTALTQADRADVLFLASGVSNARGHIPEECQRELRVLQQQLHAHPEKIACYISSYSVNDAEPQLNTPYLHHKAQMEQYVRDNASCYLIARTSNVVGFSKQPGNLMNFIYNNLRTGNPFDVWTQTSRNLIDVDDLAKMLGYYLTHTAYPLNKAVYMINPDDTPILSVVHHFEAETDLKGLFQLVDKGVYYTCDNRLATRLFDQLGIERPGYTARLIRKYFSGRR